MNRNSNYIIRIIIWSVVGLMSVVILVSAITLGSLSEVISRIFEWDGNSTEIVKERSFDSKDINNINIEWIDGTINIYPGTDDEIKIIEMKSGGLKEEEILDVSIKNQTLYIKQDYRKKIFTFIDFEINNTERDIILPEKLYEEISIKGTSGKLNIEDLEAKQFNFKLTSGKIETNNINGEELTTELTSGNMNIVGSFDSLAAEVVSGTIVLDLNMAPSKMTIKLTSGNAIISIPENEGFTLLENKASGRLQNEFQVDDFGVYKNGENKYSIKLTSGLVKLLKKSD